MKLILSNRMQALVGLGALIASYGFISLAINSASNWEYAAAVFLFSWGVIQLVRCIKKWFKKR